MTPDQPTVDGITPAEPSKASPEGKPKNAPDQTKKALSRARFALIVLAGLPYLLYFGWSLFLMAVLPSATGEWEFVIPFAKLIAMVSAIILGLIGAFGFLRIGKTQNQTDSIRYMGFARLALFILPGLALSGIVPYWITQEPSLPLRISNPPPGTEYVAPISITFNAEEAVAILKRRGSKVKNFRWDLSGDGTFDQDTITPEATGYYDKQGGYNVSAQLELEGGGSRTIQNRVLIPQAVFSYTPFVPVVDGPVQFSVAHLLPPVSQQVEVREIQWDFNQDGIPDEVTTSPETSYTFLRTGEHVVSVTILFTNQTQSNYIRTIYVNDPPPNPFPISIETTPTFLESPPPFQVVFRLITEEPLQEVKWTFDDNSPEETGERVGHTFSGRKTYQVKAAARNLNGEISRITKAVKVVQALNIPDLTFEGSHPVENGSKVNAEVPVSIDLTPKTAVPLIDFWWEAPERATQVTSTDTTLKAVFREPGLYNLVLLAKDAEGRVMRKTIALDAKPKTEDVTFKVRPPQGNAPLKVEFDASLSRIPGEQITGFVWNFGASPSNTELRYGDAYEEFTYTEPGEYTVTLTVNTLSGRSESATQTILVRAPLLKGCFTRSRSTVKVNGYVQFDWTCSTGKPTSIIWDYGDGSQAESGSADKPKVIDHVFTKVGEFDVLLKLKDDAGSSSTYSLPITVTP